MDKSGNIPGATSGGQIEPLTQYAAYFKDYSASSRRTIQSTWRALEKACFNTGVAPWPLTNGAIEAVVRQWVRRGASTNTLQVHRWALQRLHEATDPGAMMAMLSAEHWARLVWSASPVRHVRHPKATITVYETGLLVDRLGKDLESQQLCVLLQLLSDTVAPLSALLRVKRGDMLGSRIALQLSHSKQALNLDKNVVDTLLTLFGDFDQEAFLFSKDAGATPLTAQAVSAMLHRCATEILGHTVTWRAVRNASIRFLLRLGISAQALAAQSGMSIASLLRAAGLRLPGRDYGMMRRYGIPIISEWPLFTHVYQAMRGLSGRFGGARDRAIFNLLYFAFATPMTISAMDRDDFVEGMYCLEREHGWLAYGCIDRVVAALAEWVAIRGEHPGPLFIFRGKQTGPHRMTPAQIEAMVKRRSLRQPRCLTAAMVRLAGITRAADAGLPLADLADASDLTYEQLVGVLDLHQSAETVARVSLQIDTLFKARTAPDRLEQIRNDQLRRDYIHLGTP